MNLRFYFIEIVFYIDCLVYLFIYLFINYLPPLFLLIPTKAIGNSAEVELDDNLNLFIYIKKTYHRLKYKSRKIKVRLWWYLWSKDEDVR